MATKLRSKNGNFVPKTKLNVLRHHLRTKRLLIPIVLLVTVVGAYTVYKSFAATQEAYQYSYSSCLRLPDNSFKDVGCRDKSAQALIYRYYRLVLQRDPDKNGFDYWTQMLVKEKQSPELVLRRMTGTAEARQKAAQAQSGNELVNLATSQQVQSRYEAGFVNYLRTIGEIYSFKSQGLLQNDARPTLVRDGGNGAKVGNQYLWTFGDTLFSPRSVDGKSARSNTAAHAPLNNPFNVSEPLDANRAPQQFIPLSPSDQAYNNKTGKGDDRYAIWTDLVVPRPQQKDALVYYLRLKINPGGGGLNYDLLNTGIARVAEGKTTAGIVVSELFKKPDMFNGGGFVDGNTIYLYSCSNKSLRDCRLAKVPVDQATNAAKYTFWDGSAWQADLKKAKGMFPGTSAGTGIGKLPNGLYAIFYPEPFGKNIYMTTSKSITGPWQEPQKIFTANKAIYAVAYQPGLSLNSSNKRIVLTYYEPGVGLQVITSNTR